MTQTLSNTNSLTLSQTLSKTNSVTPTETVTATVSSSVLPTKTVTLLSEETLVDTSNGTITQTLLIISSSSSSLEWWVIVIIAVSALTVVALFGLFLCLHKKSLVKPKKRKSIEYESRKHEFSGSVPHPLYGPPPRSPVKRVFEENVVPCQAPQKLITTDVEDMCNRLAPNDSILWAPRIVVAASYGVDGPLTGFQSALDFDDSPPSLDHHPAFRVLPEM